MAANMSFSHPPTTAAIIRKNWLPAVVMLILSGDDLVGFFPMLRRFYVLLIGINCIAMENRQIMIMMVPVDGVNSFFDVQSLLAFKWWTVFSTASRNRKHASGYYANEVFELKGDNALIKFVAWAAKWARPAEQILVVLIRLLRETFH